MTDVVESEDLGAAYMAARERRAGTAALDGLLQRVEALPPGGEGAPPAKPQPGQEGGALATAGKIAKDIGGGLIESPRQIAGGVNDAVLNALRTLDPLVNWLERNVADLPRYEAPVVDSARTVTGNVIREGARFLTGFTPAFRALKGVGLGAGAASIAAGGISEAVTADPSSEGLANLVESVPALKNPVTEFLATDPEDPEALNRLRKGVEGAGFGMVAEGVFQGVRAAGRAIRARGAQPEDVLSSARARWGEVKDSDFALLGDAKKPVVSTAKIDKALKATEGVEPSALTEIGEAAGERVYINFARIETADDVKGAMDRAARLFAKDIDKAKRGVQSHAETQRLAEDLGMTVDDVLARRQGQPLNAEEALAARRIWTASGEKLLEAAKKAADPNAGQVDQFVFRKMMAAHYAIQAEVIGARTETARALNAWKIPAGGGVEKARAIEQLMESMGGADTSREMAKRLAILADAGTPQAGIALAVRKGWAATTMDAVKESFVNGLLWSPDTHFVNSGSNMAVMFQQIYERGAARAIGQATGRAAGEGVAEGEATAMAYALVTGLRDAWRMGVKAARTGETGVALGKIDLPREAAISSTAIARERGMSVAEAEAFRQTGLGRFVDYFGTATRIPGRALGAEDEFFKSIGYRMELHAQSLRQATQEGHKGADLYRRMAEIVSNPPENIRIAAADAALYNTFTDAPGAFARSLMAVRSAGDLNPTFLLVPFLRTPMALLRYGFERTPIAPLVGQWRADIAAGGARADLALARMATGSAIMATAADLAYSGLISGAGPSEPGKREALERQGWQANSVKIGDKWHSYNRTDPMGMPFGFSATMAEMAKRFDIEPDQMDEFAEIAGAAATAVSRSVVDKTWFAGVGQLMGVIAEGEQRKSTLERYIDRQTGALVPFTSFFGLTARAADPVMREYNSTWEYLQTRIAGLSQTLKPSRNLWGVEKAPDEVYGRAYDVLSPIAVRREKESPIDAEITRLNLDVRRIPTHADFGGVPMNLRDFPEVKDAYERLAGNELKHPAWELGAKDYLDAVVGGKHPMSQVYGMLSDGPEGGKADFIRDTISQFRGLARSQILQDPAFGEFAAEYESRRLEKMRARLPQ